MRPTPTLLIGGAAAAAAGLALLRRSRGLATLSELSSELHAAAAEAEALREQMSALQAQLDRFAPSGRSSTSGSGALPGPPPSEAPPEPTAPQPQVLVISAVPGLQAAFRARGLETSSMVFAAGLSEADLAAMRTEAEVIVGEPTAAMAKLLDRGAPRARWFASTWAGCGPLLGSERATRSEVQVTRLGGVFGGDMAE